MLKIYFTLALILGYVYLFIFSVMLKTWFTGVVSAVLALLLTEYLVKLTKDL